MKLKNKINQIYDDVHSNKIECDDAEIKIEKLNNKYLKEFEKYLIIESLSPRTIKRAVSRVDTFINGYLCYRFDGTIYKGWETYHDFFTYFLVYKCLNTVNTSIVKEYLSSLRKFYSFMFKNGYISEQDYLDNEFMIKDFKSEWIECVKDFN